MSSKKIPYMVDWIGAPIFLVLTSMVLFCAIAETQIANRQSVIVLLIISSFIVIICGAKISKKVDLRKHYLKMSDN
jgi:glucose-6-phosphate-specific signal transduction histidine kinase